LRAGIFIPNGITGELRGWDPRLAWERGLALGQLADDLGFDSLWVPDHMHNVVAADDAPTFEAFTQMAALAGVTSRVTLVPGVACVGFRNPALLAKMMTTLDVASNGRAECAIGAGWNEREWNGYGYGFPPARERLQLLREALEVITRMFQPGRATWTGERYRVENAICEPKGIQSPRLPIIVGGNGPNVTWRLAARYADELNLDEPSLDAIPGWLPTIRQRCEEIGRDPATLRLSALFSWNDAAGQQRIDGLARLAELGLTRIQSPIDGDLTNGEWLLSYAEDCRLAGVELLA
jgi:F420-dependent oxidoreductase-like protein